MFVRYSADWMVLADDRILEVLESEGKMTPTMLSGDERIHFGRQYVNNRLGLLLEVGMVRKVGRGIYQITNAGADYLAGEYDASDLPDPTE